MQMIIRFMHVFEEDDEFFFSLLLRCTNDTKFCLIFNLSLEFVNHLHALRLHFLDLNSNYIS